MPSFNSLLAGLVLYLGATTSSIAVASPVAAGEGADKRQAAILPPPDCGDEQAFFNCATDNPQYCFAPSPITVAQCYGACSSCCDGDADTCGILS